MIHFTAHSRGVFIAAVVAALLGGAALLSVSPPPALAAHHPCGTGEFCLYFNEDANGGYYHFERSDANLDNDRYEGGDLGETVGDTARYVWNNGVPAEQSDVIVYGLPNFKGAADCVKRGQRGTLPRKWWNNIESYRWVTRSECTSAGFIFDAESGDPKPSCHPYEVVGVRGSGESLRSGPYGMGNTVGPIAKAAIDQLGSRLTRPVSLRYPALPVTVMLRRGGIRTFFDSILIGERMLLREVGRTLARCPRTRFGLIGYSQGAAVVSEALREMTRGQRRHVSAAVLVADPYSTGQSDYSLTLTPITKKVKERRGGHGVLGAESIPLPDDRLVDVCYAGDLVCDIQEGATRLLLQLLVAPVHTTYKTCCSEFQLPRVLGSGLASTLAGS
jgi:hypothetical protein